jgi:hypothetical protein
MASRLPHGGRHPELAGTGIFVGAAWTCNQDTGSGCANTWTWTGEGWTPATSPAGFAARKVRQSSWRDFFVTPQPRANILVDIEQVKADLEQRRPLMPPLRTPARSRCS